MRRAYLVTKPDKDILRTQTATLSGGYYESVHLKMKRLRSNEIRNWPKTTELTFGNLTSEHRLLTITL